MIRECSACAKHIMENTLGSGNTIGARFWTDGKRVAPMLPDSPWLVKCPHCKTLVWIDEQRKVGEVPPWVSAPAEFPDARPAKTPAFTDYAKFIKAGVRDREHERYVRTRAWWAGNDPRRKDQQPTPLTDFESQNLRALVKLLDEADGMDRLMKAEALRELGEFAAAEELLAVKFDDDLRHAVLFIRDLIQKRMTAVAELLVD